jgi:hypothetical protein
VPQRERTDGFACRYAAARTVGRDRSIGTMRPEKELIVPKRQQGRGVAPAAGAGGAATGARTRQGVTHAPVLDGGRMRSTRALR